MMTLQRVLTTLLTALVLLGPATTAAAQDYVPTPVTISKDKVKIKGKTYYSHVVLERQTLYSIAQAYGVTVQEIYDANPGLSVLKKNAIILIPDKDARGYQPPVETVPPVPEEVQPAPPAPEETATETGVPEGYTRYIVKWNDTLYSIAEKFGVSVESIQIANGILGDKIKKRQELLIPSPEQAAQLTTHKAENEPAQTAETAEAAEEETLPAPELTEETVEEPEETVSETAQAGLAERFKSFFGTDVTFSLVLPFKTSGKVSENNVDFYAGVLLAIKDLAEREGIHANLSVYDLPEVENGDKPFKDPDFILGPISRESLSKILRIRPAGVPVISPLDQKAGSLAGAGEGMIQIPASTDYQYQDLIQWLQEDYSIGERILLISEKDAAATDYTTKISARLAGLPHKSFSYGILQGRNVSGSLTDLLVKDRTNRVVIASENEAFVNDVIRNLNVLTHKDFDIEVYAPAKFRNYETIEVESLHNVRLHVTCPYYIDYGTDAVRHFLMEYRAFCQTEPSQFAFQGYDIATYLVETMARYGSAWKDALLENPSTGTQIHFDFKQTASGSLENTGTRRIIYERDFSVRCVR